MQTEEIYAQIAVTLEAEKSAIASIRQSVERCEKLPTVHTNQLLNLPVKAGKTLEH